MKTKILVSITIFLVVFTQLWAQSEVIDFESDQWILQNAEIKEHLGRTGLCGNAVLKDVEFTNGTIEVDVAVSGARSYPGVNFRIQSNGNAEHFYIRPHRAGLYPDAIQYTPILNGISSWQLYNGDGFTNSGEFPENEWMHLKLEIAGKQARVFINDALVLEIPELQLGECKGAIGVSGPKNSSAYFSNFCYKIDDSLELPPAPPKDIPPGFLTEWEISQTFHASQVDFEKHPSNQEIEELTWQKVIGEATGLVDVGKVHGRTGRETDVVFAKTVIESDAAQTKKFVFGYSDAISVFLNGEILYFGNSAYQQRDPSFLGIIGLNDALYLPLKAGKNELMIIVAESFGGWGFMFQDANAVFIDESVSKLWETEGLFLMPEGVAYDAERQVFYISNYDGNRLSPAEEGQSISKVEPDGKIVKLKWVTGVERPTGMAVYKNKLYVVTRKNLVEIDLKKEMITAQYPFPVEGFANDIIIDKGGVAYITISNKNTICQFKKGKIEVWLEDAGIARPNGINILKDELIVGVNSDQTLKAVNLKTKEIRMLAKLSAGVIDGIEVDESGNLLVSHWEGRIFRITPQGQVTKIVDTAVPQHFSADFKYVPEKKMLVVPTFYGNSVLAYKLKK